MWCGLWCSVGYSVVWCGVVWCGVVWCGLWCGVCELWRGVGCSVAAVTSGDGWSSVLTYLLTLYLLHILPTFVRIALLER